MTDTTRIKLNLRTGEIEIEGSESFVERQVSGLQDLVALFAKDTALSDMNGDAKSDASSNGGNGEDAPIATAGEGNPPTVDKLPPTFGEWMHGFRTDLTDEDKALVTARFVQSQSKENDFKTSEVNKSLQQHGIKLANPSLALKRLATKKLMFQTRRVGKLRFMRISQDGQAHLGTLKR